jgi:outer membrane murein-binding lipoprotein Lpp
MSRRIGRMLAAAVLASVMLAGCSHTSLKANAAGSERGYSSNGEVKLGMPF